MKITVRLFAWARERAGSEELLIELPRGASVAELRAVLRDRHPELELGSKAVRIALNDEYAGEEEIVHAHDGVAVIPPVAGG